MLPLVPTNDERAKEWDMPFRAQALKDFYGGPVWKTHREAANATMIDSDNVLLSHPATPTSGFSLGEQGTSSSGSKRSPERVDRCNDLLQRRARFCKGDHNFRAPKSSSF